MQFQSKILTKHIKIENWIAVNLDPIIMRLKPTSSAGLLVYIFIVCWIQVSAQISHIKYYQAEHALAHVVRSLKNNKLEQIDDEYKQICTASNICCRCQKNFKNTSYLELHMNLHHPIPNQNPQNSMLVYIFDKKINSELRFQVCTKLLTFMDIQSILEKNPALNNQQQNQQRKVQIYSNLSKSQIVDSCTMIAYGAYHKPLWRFWIKWTLIFGFAVIFLVYYASLFDQINQKYFPKKQKNQISRNR